jgi:Pyridoxamine 5'-phosphate oxidase
MAIPLSNEIRELLDGPNFAHLATLMPDGSPQSVPGLAVKMTES